MQGIPLGVHNVTHYLSSFVYPYIRTSVFFSLNRDCFAGAEYGEFAFVAGG
jgi:hypothetical protein